MIQTIEKQRDEIFNPREGPHSSTPKSSNENTPNIQKKNTQIIDKVCLPKKPSKKDVNQFCETIPYNKPFNSQSTGSDITINGNNSSQNSNDEQNIKKDFIEKKRRRRNKCSYSYNRNRKSKKKPSNSRINQSGTSRIINIDLIYENITGKKSTKNELEQTTMNQNKTVIEMGNKTQNDNNQNSKKKTKIDEKELIAKAEKMFKERINKEYSDEQYNQDLDMNLKEKRAQFMKEHFPIMYTKDKYYLYTVLLKKRRTQPINFIQPKALSQMIQESQKLQTLYLNEELEPPENISSENSDDDKIQKTKNKKNPTSKINRCNQKPQSKSKQKQSVYSEIIPSINQSNNNNKSIKEVEQIKQNLTDPKQPIQENNKKYGGGLSDTSPSEHDAKNSELNHLIDEIEEQNELNNNGIKCKKSYNLLPKQIWSFPKDNPDLDIEKFYDDCVQIWPFTECIFVKEIALEFLMKNNYSTSICLKRIKDFVSFMKKRAEELDISILNKNEKTVKKYSLRKSKNH